MLVALMFKVIRHTRAAEGVHASLVPSVVEWSNGSFPPKPDILGPVSMLELPGPLISA
jgi:hypothetical protein